RGNRSAHRLPDRDFIHERAGLLRRLEWIIGGKHHALVAERGDGAIERFGRTHAGCRDDEIVLEILRRRLAELDRIKIRSSAAVEAPEQERQCLAEMAEADAGTREAVKQPAENQPQRMRSGFERPLPGRAPQSLVALQYRRRADRIDGMQVNERTERFSALPERMERSVVEILSIGMPIDHRTGEFEPTHATLELGGGGTRILHGERGKSRIAIGPALDLPRQKIVGRTRAANGERSIAFRLHAGTRQPNHRAGNAGFIHRGEPQFTKIGQPRQRPIPALSRQIDDGWIPIFDKIGAEEMLLKRDLCNHMFSSGASREAGELSLSVPHNGYSVQSAVLGWHKQNKRRSSVAKTIRGVAFEENENNAMGLEFYNLSHRFGYQSPNWPYFEDVKIERIHYMAKSGVLSQRITTSMHNTTHIDAPAHVVQGTPFIDEVPLPHFFGSGIVASIPKNKWEPITGDDLEPACGRITGPGDVVIINTGWHKVYEDSEDYFCRAPGFVPSAGEWFVKRKIKVVGHDTQANDHPLATAIGPQRNGPLHPHLAEEYREWSGGRDW